MAFKSWRELQEEDRRSMALLDLKKQTVLSYDRMLAEKARSLDPQLSMDQWANFFTFGGLQYPFIPTQTIVGNKEDIPNNFVGYVHSAYQANGVVFACILARLKAFSEVRFQWQRLADQGSGRPQDLWGNSRLAILEKPWPNAVTGDLLARMEQDSSIGGNFYGARLPIVRTRRDDNGRPIVIDGKVQFGTLFGDPLHPRIFRLRPDWVTIVIGSMNEPLTDDSLAEITTADPDSVLLGYLYHPGGYRSGRDPIFFNVDEVCHYAPIPDPLAAYRGMSWITPVLREIMGDSAATSHKLKFFENGATVNMVVMLDPDIQEDAFNRWIEIFRTQHEGAMNAYRTLYIAGGADVKTVGADFRQMDFKATQGAGETRIAAASGVPPAIVGLSEGLASATYSNYAQERRALADLTIRPLWRNASGSLETICPPPPGNRLWYDDHGVGFLREDLKDAAAVQQAEASTMNALITAGFRPDSVVAAVRGGGDWSLLKHSGMYSVQLQPPGTTFPGPNPLFDGTKPPAPPSLPPAGGNGNAPPNGAAPPKPPPPGRNDFVTLDEFEGHQHK